MVNENILTIGIGDINFNAIKFKMINGLTLDRVKIKYNWIFNANIKDAIIGEDRNGLVWYSGTWVDGTWENGTWYSGVFLNGRWKGGNVYSFDIDVKQLLSGNYNINSVDISKTHFVKCSFEGGTFHYGIFGNIKNKEEITLPYLVDRDFILNNIMDYEINNGFNTGYNIGFNDINIDHEIIKIITDKENNILLGGKFNKYNNISVNNLLRLNNDGTFNSSFNVGVNGIVNDMVFDSNEKLLIGGEFSKYQDKTHNSILKLNKDNSLDETFSSGVGVFKYREQLGIIKTIAVDSDDCIFIGGEFTKYNNVIRYDNNYITNIVKLKTNGDIDKTFKTNLGFDGIINVIKIDRNGKILIGGEFTKYNGKLHKKIIRLNKDGSVDSEFDSVGFNGGVNTIELDKQGNIYVGGIFISYKYNKNIIIECNKLIKLKSNGHIFDIQHGISTGFNFAYGLTNDSYINTIKVDKNNKVYVGGYFNKFNNKNVDNFIKINADGTLDPLFSKVIKMNNNSKINSVVVDSNNNIYIGGKFNIYNNTNINILTRLDEYGNIDNTNKKTYYDKTIMKAIFNGGTFVGGLFNSAVFKNGVFKSGFFNNSIWHNGVWYGGEFLDGEWHDGLFLSGVFSNGNWYGGTLSKTGDKVTSFGLNFKNKTSNVGNWYGGDFSGGKMYSSYNEKIENSNELNEIVKNDMVNWYNGNFLNGEWYGGTIHNCIWKNGEMYDGIINDIEFNDGHIFNVICNGGIFNGGRVTSGIFENVEINNLDFGYEIY